MGDFIMTEYNEVLKRITALREDRGWKLFRLAKESDMSYSTLKNLYDRNNMPTIPVLIRVCGGLGITLAEFFDYCGEMPKQKSLTKTESDLLKRFNMLRPTDKRAVEALICGLENKE
jgi:transcriptional regulator with XRE-family HTH domain